MAFGLLPVVTGDVNAQRGKQDCRKGETSRVARDASARSVP